MTNTLELHGILGDKFGKKHEIKALTPASMIYSMMLQNKEFANYNDKQNYRILRSSMEGYMEINKISMRSPLKPREVIKIIPAVEQGIKIDFRTILAIALLAIGFYYAAPAVAGGKFAFSTPLLGGFTTAGGVALWGGIMLFGSITGFFDPQEQEPPDTQDERRSFLFDGPINLTRSGTAIPLVYGVVRTGSVLISSQLKAVESETNVTENSNSALVGTMLS